MSVNSSSSDPSLSLSAGILLDNNVAGKIEDEKHSSISEHLPSLTSLENDRSLLEIEIHNVLKVNSFASDMQQDMLSGSLSSTNSNSGVKNAQSVLEEILQNEQFDSSGSDKLDSNNDVSLNIFDGLNLEDSSITEYHCVHKLQQKGTDNCNLMRVNTGRKLCSLEEAISAKDSIVQALNNEIESLKDMASNPSTLSLNTACTEYKQFQEECAARFVNFENALIHRDQMINKLKELLINAQKHESDMHAECQQYSEDIQCLQKELADAVEYIKNCKLCKCLNKSPESVRRADDELNSLYDKMNAFLKPGNADFMHEMREKVDSHINSKINECKTAHQVDIAQLKNTHASDMDNTRQFYEKKCAEYLSGNLMDTYDTQSEQHAGLTHLMRQVQIAIETFQEGGENDAVQKLKELLLTILRHHDNNENKINVHEGIKIHVATQADSGEFELAGIVKSYQVQLSEEIVLAKLEIASALEAHITMLAASNCDDDDWPKELLEIRNKLSEKYVRQINEMCVQHVAEIEKLKIDRAKAPKDSSCRAARRSLDFSEDSSSSTGGGDVLKERKTTNALRNLLIESYKYFSQCEEELNTTLFDELAKQSVHDSDSDFNLNDMSMSSSSKTTDTSSARRLHLAPNITEFIDKIDKSDLNVSLEFRNQLGACLERLRSDANAILALTLKQPQDATKSLDAQDELTQAKHLAKSLEFERHSLEQQLEEATAKYQITERELRAARGKIAELIEYGRKEIVSEGFGVVTLHASTRVRIEMLELYEQARQIVAEFKNTVPPNVLKTIEDLYTECENLNDDLKRDRYDFTQQIDSADKKLKSTQSFLDEQAAEREHERDEALRTINLLKGQLKERDKDRAGFERVNEEVQKYERELHEMSEMIKDRDKKNHELNVERAQAVEKIAVLRDIIQELELRAEVQNKTVVELQELINEQRVANDELVAQLEAASSSKKFQDVIAHLQEEVSELRRTNDIVGNEGLIKHIQLQLHDLELSVDKNIRDFESLYVGSKAETTCSTPSEEMSVQDHIRPKTPNSNSDDCEVTLQQLARLREKLMKQARTENSSLKRIQDLELQLERAKEEQAQLTSERDVLQEQVSEQIVCISSLQMRLDDQRIRTERVQKQANASLEMRIYDLETDLDTLGEKLKSRESTIKQLNVVIEETKKRLKDREDELIAALEDSEAPLLKAELDKLQVENDLLRKKIESDITSAQILPGLVDNIITDKNRDIDVLRCKLEDTEKQFELYRTFNSTEKRDEVPRNLLSYFNVTSPDKLRNMANLHSIAIPPDISSIERADSPRLHHLAGTSSALAKPNSTEIHKSYERHVHFADETSPKVMDHQQYQELHDKLNAEMQSVQELRVELAETKMHLIDREQLLKALESDIRRKDDMYLKLMRDKREVEKKFNELDSIRDSIMVIKSNEERLTKLLDHKEEVLVDKVKEYESLQSEFQNYKVIVNEEFKHKLTLSQQEVADLVICIQDARRELEAHKVAHDREVIELNTLLTYERELKEKLQRSHEEDRVDVGSIKKSKYELQNVLQKKEVAEKELQIVKLKATIDDLKREIIHLQDFVNEKDKIIDTMKVDSETLRVNLETIKGKLNEVGNVYELREKLAREQQRNAQLSADIEIDTPSDDIAEQVRQQLHDSAHLDETIISALAEGDGTTTTDMLKAALIIEHKAKQGLEEKMRDLEIRLHQSMQTIKQLQDTIEDQQKLCAEIQNEDTNLMNQMQHKLQDALENEIEFVAVLDKEKQIRLQLEHEIDNLRKKESNSVSTSTEYKSMVNIQAQLLQKELNQSKLDITNLKLELKEIRKAKIAAESALTYTKELVKAKEQEIEKLQARISEGGERVRTLKDNLLQNKVELESKVREIEHSRTFIDELAQEKLQQMNQWAEEKNLLLDKIRNYEEPSYDLATNGNHVFGKYLRADSYRNALAYQKRYLISLLSSYQSSLAYPLSKFKPKHARHQCNALSRFRSTVIVCIAIFRMQYMVKRWHSGTRCSAYLSLQRKFRTCQLGAHFQIGQPVYGKHFNRDLFKSGSHNLRASGATTSSIEWSGLSPPSKDIGARIPLASPSQLAEDVDSYIERFNTMQQRLSLALSNFNS